MIGQLEGVVNQDDTFAIAFYCEGYTEAQSSEDDAEHSQMAVRIMSDFAVLLGVAQTNEPLSDGAEVSLGLMGQDQDINSQRGVRSRADGHFNIFNLQSALRTPHTLMITKSVR